MRDSDLLGYFTKVTSGVNDLTQKYDYLRKQFENYHRRLNLMRLELNAMLDVLLLLRPVSYPLIWVYKYVARKIEKKYTESLKKQVELMKKAEEANKNVTNNPKDKEVTNV